MFKKAFSILLVLVLVASLMVGCGQNADKPADGGSGTGGGETVYVNIATGGTGGVYYPLGGALAKVYNDKLDNISANSQSTGASVENIGLILDDEAQIAFIQNDITYYAAEGIEMFEDKGKAEDLRGMAIWYPEVIQIVATKGSGIETVEDLKGKKVAVGAPGSGTEANARQILEAHGITYDDIQADYLSFDEASTNLQDGNVDAAFVTAGLPTAAIVELTTSTDVVIVPIESGVIADLSAEYPFYTEVVIEAGTYKDQAEDVTTTAVMAMLVVHKDMDEDLAYELTKAMFENKDIIDETHDRGKDLQLETALEG
ncbi:MAG TPA: TAXI family TRAP transporter solute-binding subunit, partial [Tissierellaceae bacterium]|nr:TAXI family TRAP transporter solute-binding subunit [Tissierellaceae bacterium]